MGRLVFAFLITKVADSVGVVCWSNLFSFYARLSMEEPGHEWLLFVCCSLGKRFGHCDTPEKP